MDAILSLFAASCLLANLSQIAGGKLTEHTPCGKKTQFFIDLFVK